MRARLVTLPVGAALAVLVAFGPAPGQASGQPEGGHVDVLIRYTCVLPDGPVPAEVRITADLPADVAVHEPIQPGAVSLTLTLPPPGLPDAATVTAVGALETSVVRQETVTATWSGSVAGPVPMADPLVLSLPVDAPPPIVATEPGDLVLGAGTVTATVTGHTAEGTATEPPAAELTCHPDPDQATLLATVVVTGTEEEPPPGTELPPGTVVVEPEAAGDPGQPPAPANRVEIPPDCEIIDPPEGPATAARYCAYVTAYTNVAKLGASVLQPAGIVNIGPTSFYPRCEDDPVLRCQQANILPNLNGDPKLPEAPGAFVAYGFMPIEAKLQLTQLGFSFADIKLDAQAPHSRSGAVISARYSARVYDATVNGVPLDLGPNCVTAEPLEISVRANVPPYTLTVGGLLTGMVRIPAFDGCGATEDLDPLVSGLVSGPDNYVALTQGRLCTLTGSQGGCPPPIPAPQTPQQ